ncbi:MAG: DUF4126 domain-containing protein [Vicinamibacterales bacterium]
MPEFEWLDVMLAIAAGVGLAAATGLRVFLPMLVLGCAARAEWIPLGADFGWLASNAGLITLAMATLAEVAAYYLPVIDNALDVVATPAAVIAGIVTLAAVTSDLPAPMRWTLAIIAGGGTAGMVQSLTTVARLKSTGFTAGLANPLLATIELVGALGVSVLAVVAPLLAIVGAVMIVAIYRRLRTKRVRT